MLKPAKSLKDAKCLCKATMRDDFFRENYSDKWSILKQKEANEDDPVVEKKGRKKLCGYCKNKLDKDIAVLSCTHEYCRKCLKGLMEEAIENKSVIKCKTCPKGEAEIMDFDEQAFKEVNSDMFAEYKGMLRENNNP